VEKTLNLFLSAGCGCSRSEQFSRSLEEEVAGGGKENLRKRGAESAGFEGGLIYEALRWGPQDPGQAVGLFSILKTKKGYGQIKGVMEGG